MAVTSWTRMISAPRAMPMAMVAAVIDGASANADRTDGPEPEKPKRIVRWGGQGSANRAIIIVNLEIEPATLLRRFTHGLQYGAVQVAFIAGRVAQSPVTGAFSATRPGTRQQWLQVRTLAPDRGDLFRDVRRRRSS